MAERKQSFARLDRGFDSVVFNVQKQAERARKLIRGLIEAAEAYDPFPELPFIYERRGSECVHLDVRHEKAVKLGEETDNHKKGYHIILKPDGTIVSIANADTRRVYMHGRERHYERQLGGRYELAVRTTSRLKEVQYSGEKQTKLRGVNYLKWSSAARDMLMQN